jgi:hypothetical protein
LLVLDVKMLVKCIAILVLLLINRQLFREKEIWRQPFTWSYWSMIVIAVFNLLLTIPSFSLNYAVAVLTGIGFWLLCIGAAFLNYWFVMRTGKEKLDQTLTLFFILNAAVSIVQLLFIMQAAGSVNPYTYQGEFQKYFINTGDRIKGITFDLSATNSFINAFGVIYFLYAKKTGKTLLCMLTLLLAVSNYTNILLFAVLGLVFIFQSDRIQKSLIAMSFIMMVIFITKVSPQNGFYIKDAYTKMTGGKLKNRFLAANTNLAGRPDSLLTPEERKKKFALLYVDSIGKEQLKKMEKEEGLSYGAKPSLPKVNIHSAPYWRKKDTTALQREMLRFISEKLKDPDSSIASVKARRLPAKLIAFGQIADYFKEHPARILTGTGAGNFSSKLAFRVAGMHIAGGYPSRFAYINEAFLNNHFRLYLDYFSKDIELQSLVNSPNSVYAQVSAEYGLAGVISFIVFYLFYFAKRAGRYSYGWPLLLLVLGAMATDYWFEHLSIIILFELMMLVLIKTKHAGN